MFVDLSRLHLFRDMAVWQSGTGSRKPFLETDCQFPGLPKSLVVHSTIKDFLYFYLLKHFLKRSRSCFTKMHLASGHFLVVSPMALQPSANSLLPRKPNAF